MDHKFPRQGSSPYHTWFITVRPRDGISQERIDILSAWIAKQAYYLMVTEGSGDSRHAHICVAFRTARIRSNVINAVLMLKGMNFDADEAKAFRSRNYKGQPNPQIWYNFDAVDEYLSKDPMYRIILNQLPSKSERDDFMKEWMPAPDDKRIERGPSTNAEWRRLKKLYYEEDLPPGVQMSESWFIRWFNDLGNQDKLRIEVDQKRLRDKVRRFMLYVYNESADHYLGSEAKRLKTMAEEDDDWDHIDRIKNPHKYIDSEDKHILDMYLTKRH